MKGLRMPIRVLFSVYNLMNPINSTQAEFIVQSASDDIGLDITIRSTSVPSVTVSTTDGSSTLEAWVVLDGNENVLLWTDSQFLAMIFKMY